MSVTLTINNRWWQLCLLQRCLQTSSCIFYETNRHLLTKISADVFLQLFTKSTDVFLQRYLQMSSCICLQSQQTSSGIFLWSLQMSVSSQGYIRSWEASFAKFFSTTKNHHLLLCNTAKPTADWKLQDTRLIQVWEMSVISCLLSYCDF